MSRAGAHPLNDADGLVVLGALGVADVVGHPIEHRGQHRLEHGPGHVGTHATVHANAEAEVPVALSVKNELVGFLEDGRVAVGHRPGDPESLTLLELRPFHLDVLREGAAVARCGREEAQELFGGRVQQGVAFAAEQLALVGVLRQPLERVRGERGRGVEAAADDQPKIPHDLEIRCGLAIDAQLQQRVDQTWPGVLLDLDHVGEQVDAHLAVHLRDALGLGRVPGGGHRQVRRLAVDHPLVQLDAHHRQGEYCWHDVGEVVDEVDAARFDLLVKSRPHDFVDEWLPPLDRGGGEIRVQRTAVGAVLGLVHFQDAAAHDCGPLCLGDGDALVRTSLR